MISRSSYRVLSLLLSFGPSGFFTSTSLPRVWVANGRPAVVLFYNLALLVLLLILIPSVLCRTTAPTEHHLYLIVSASGSHLFCVFPLSSPRRCLFSPVLSCSRFYRMCILLFPIFDPFRSVYFLSDHSPFPLFIFPPLHFSSSLILCYLTCIRSRNC